MIFNDNNNKENLVVKRGPNRPKSARFPASFSQKLPFMERSRSTKPLLLWHPPITIELSAVGREERHRDGTGYSLEDQNVRGFEDSDALAALVYFSLDAYLPPGSRRHVPSPSGQRRGDGFHV